MQENIKKIVSLDNDFDEIKKSFGLNITIHTTTDSKDQAQTLLENLGMVFANEE